MKSKEKQDICNVTESCEHNFANFENLKRDHRTIKNRNCYQEKQKKKKTENVKKDISEKLKTKKKCFEEEENI